MTIPRSRTTLVKSLAKYRVAGIRTIKLSFLCHVNYIHAKKPTILCSQVENRVMCVVLDTMETVLCGNLFCVRLCCKRPSFIWTTIHEWKSKEL